MFDILEPVELNKLYITPMNLKKNVPERHSVVTQLYPFRESCQGPLYPSRIFNSRHCDYVSRFRLGFEHKVLKRMSPDRGIHRFDTLTYPETRVFPEPEPNYKTTIVELEELIKTCSSIKVKRDPGCLIRRSGPVPHPDRSAQGRRITTDRVGCVQQRSVCDILEEPTGLEVT